MSETKSKWEEVASEDCGYCGQPGSQFNETTATLYRRGSRFRCVVKERWGSNQGYMEVHGCNETEGRGDSPEEAIEACRKDVFAWALDNEKTRAEFATMLRKLAYAAEDADSED